MNKKKETIRDEQVIILFGKRIRQLRIKNGMSQEDLSYYSGITPTYISKIENGKFNTSLSHVAALAEAFELPIHALLEFSCK